MFMQKNVYAFFFSFFECIYSRVVDAQPSDLFNQSFPLLMNSSHGQYLTEADEACSSCSILFNALWSLLNI